MHGTFRRHIEGEAVKTMRFGARPEDVQGPLAARASSWRSKLAALLAGCCLAVLPNATIPSSALNHEPASLPRWESEPLGAAEPSAMIASIAEPEPNERIAPSPSTPPPATIAPRAPVRLAGLVPQRAPLLLTTIPPPVRPLQAQPLEPVSESPAALEPLHATIADIPPPQGAIPMIDVEPTAPPAFAVILPDPPPAAVADIPGPRGAMPMTEVELTAPPAFAIVLPDPPLAPPPAKPQAVASEEALRPVDIAQLADSEVRSLRVPQLHEPGLAPGGAPTLAARIDAMQVTPPPPVRIGDEERAALLAEAPSEMLVRIGDSALGEVAFRMTDARTIDVQLSGMLDLLADHFDSSEFERLRNSAAADSFVDFDQLRAIGLNLHYDPVYDELRITS